MSSLFTDEELLAYADERLPVARASELELLLRSSPAEMNRLAELIHETGDFSLGSMWRRGRWSCPPRAVWIAFLDQRLGDAMTQYLKFHLNTIGCRICEANIADLQQTSNSSDSERRVRQIFQSSAGRLSSDAAHPSK